jgi:hypothetical protein
MDDFEAHAMDDNETNVPGETTNLKPSLPCLSLQTTTMTITPVYWP